ENSKLRKVVADLRLDKEKLQDVISAAPATPSDSSLRNGATAAPETRFEHAATAQQGRASGAGGTIRLASRRGGQLPCHAGGARRWRLDEIGREEGKRDCHIHLADAAPLALSDAVRGCGFLGDKFIEPTAPAGD